MGQVINFFTKFDNSGFSHSRNGWCPPNLSGSLDLITLLLGIFATRELVLATINLSAIFEVSTSTYYGDMKGDTIIQSVKNGVVWG